MNISNCKSLCFITGSSRGFGRCIAELLVQDEQLFANCKAGSKIVLCGRSINDLEDTKKLMIQFCKDLSNITIDILTFDLANAAEVEKEFKNYLATLDEDFENCFFFNNAATLGNISSVFTEFKINEIEMAYTVNVVVPIFLISQFCNKFIKSNQYVIQTSTLAAIQPLSCMSLYCSSKASMDMFLQAISIDHPKIRTLNYAPGPLDTDMVQTIIKDIRSDETKKLFGDMISNATILQPIDSSRKLIQLLKRNEFKNGDHVDYFDIK